MSLPISGSVAHTDLMKTLRLTRITKRKMFIDDDDDDDVVMLVMTQLSISKIFADDAIRKFKNV